MSEASRQRQGRDARGGRSRRRLVVAGLVVLLVAAGVGVAIAAAGGDEGGAPAAVSVEGVDVSGASREEVVAAVRARARELVREPLVIVRTDKPGFRVAATRAELGARPRVKAAVDEAMEPRNFGGRLLSNAGHRPDARRRDPVHPQPGAGHRADPPRDRTGQRPGALGEARGDRRRHRAHAGEGGLRDRPRERCVRRSSRCPMRSPSRPARSSPRSTTRPPPRPASGPSRSWPRPWT